MTRTDDRIEIENFTSPGQVRRVDRAKFSAMKDAPGLTAAEAKQRLLPLLPQDLFPNGEKAGWWMKAAQLDQEAKGVIRREATKPLRFFRVV